MICSVLCGLVIIGVGRLWCVLMCVMVVCVVLIIVMLVCLLVEGCVELIRFLVMKWLIVVVIFVCCVVWCVDCLVCWYCYRFVLRLLVSSIMMVIS